MAEPQHVELAKAYVTIIPSMQGAQQTITTELTGAAAPAGEEAGEAIGSSMISSLEEALGDVGKTLSATVTAPIVAAATASVAAFSSVDDALDDVAIRTGATGDALEGMQNITRDIATSMPAAWGDVGAAVGEVNTRFGATGEELDDLSRYFLQYARINNQNVASSVDNVSRVIAGFGLETSDATRILDMLNVVGQQTGEDVGQLSEALATNAGTFSAMGLSAEEAASFMAQASLAGLTTQQSMTGLRSAINYASSEGLTLSEVFETVTQNADDSGLMMDVFGSRAGLAIGNAVANGTVSLTDFSSVLGDFSGSVQTTFEGTLDPLDEMTTTLNSLKELGYELVDAFGPVISDVIGEVIPVIQDLTDKWKALDPQTQQTIIKLALIAAAIGPVLMAGSKLVGMFRTVGSGLTSLGSTFANFGGQAANAASAATGATASFSSMAGTALMLVALGAAIWMVAEGMSVMADAAIRLAESGPAAIAVFFGMVGAATAMAAVILLVGSAATVSAVGLLALGAAILMITGGIALITEACAHLVSEINGLVQTIIAGANEINSIINTLGRNIQMIIITVVAGIITVVDNLGRTIDRTVSNLSRNIQQTIRSVGQTITQIVNSIGGNVSRVLDSVSGVIDTVGRSAVNTGRGFDTFTDAVQRLVGMNLLDMVATFTAVSRGLDAIVNSARGIPDATRSIRDLSNAFRNTTFNFNQGHIALPHFTMTGNFNAQSRTVPQVRVQWYAAAATQGARFTAPQIIGVGDARQPEILLGEDKLRELVGARQTPINVTVNAAPGQNVNELADAVAVKLQRELNRNRAVYA